MNQRYNSIADLLRRRFGERTFKVSLQSGLGCPHQRGGEHGGGCLFCHPGGLTPATAIGQREDCSAPVPIGEQLREGIAYIRQRHRGTERVIAAFQEGTNTAAPATELVPLFERAIAHPAVVGLSVSTRPDCLADEQIALLARLAQRTFVWVELGLQSAHDVTLARINRGHDVAAFTQACTRLHDAGLPVCAHVILGLPGETPAMMEETARFLNRCGVWGVKLHNLHILRETGFEELYRNGAIALPTLSEYARLAVDVLECLDPRIVVHRINSHSPRWLTVAPAWSVNKLAVVNAVAAELERRDTWQGRRFAG